MTKLAFFALSTAFALLWSLSSAAADAAKPAPKPDAKAAAPAAAPAPAPAATPASGTPTGAPAAPAPAATEQAPPAPPAELATHTKALLGKWKCDGKVPQTAFTKAHAIKADLLWSSNLGGFFVSMRYDEKKDKTNPQAYAMTSVVGWDAERKQLARIDYDNIGMISKLTSPGWQDKTLIWNGETTSGQTFAFRETLTQKTPKLFSMVQEMAGPDGAMVVIGELSCKK